MEQKIINIGNKVYRCKIANTEEEKQKGLMHVESLPPDEGMLFTWNNEDTRYMWMKNTLIPLDIIAINDDDEVTMVYQASPNNSTLIPFANTKYILEVNQGSNVQIGDDFEIQGDLGKYVMRVISPDGGTLFFLLGGERIVSRKETRVLIKKAKKAEELKTNLIAFDRVCKSLGKYMFKVLHGQDNRDAQYVLVPEKGNK